MIRSLSLYAKYTSGVLISRYRSLFYVDLNRDFFHKKNFKSGIDLSSEVIKDSLNDAINWLLHSNSNSDDDGMGSFHLNNGWTSSYPETTGYIITTLLNYSQDDKVKDVAIKAADWLISIQMKSGGWQGGRVTDNRPEIVFNTGQIIRGMISAYKLTSDKKYIDSAVKAADWLCEVQHTEGFWKENALMNEYRVYDSFVDAPLIELGDILKNKKYIDASCKNLDWIIKEQQMTNGWFRNCDNTIKHNSRPILHTIAYTIDGILDSGLLLKNDEYIEAAIKSAKKLLEVLTEKGMLHGRFDENWNGSEYPILTGLAQMSLVWLKIYDYKKDADFLIGAEKLLKQLLYLQKRGIKEDENTRGAISGSFPLWGKYEPFAYPNWATKFFADAILYYKNLKKN